MKLLKTIAYGTCLMLLSTAVFAQSRSNETSVEDIYLTNVQDVIITELANSQDYDNKLVALQYLEDSVKSGKVSEEQRVALKNLAGEGITTRVRQNGRLMNNFPDIRAKACDLLGEIKTEFAQLNSTLSQFMQAHQVQKPQTEVERQVFGAFEGETGPTQQKL